jgi:hypothetical protein
MPMRVSAPTGGGNLAVTPFVGPINHTVAIRVDVSTLTSSLVDSRGYLKAGVMLARTGVPVAGAALKYGAVVEHTKVAASNSTADLNAATDIDVAVAVICAMNRAILENSLGRVLTADEIASPAGSSPIVLLF